MARAPETPCLFFPEGLDWRWWSRRQLAAGALAWARQLAVHPPGTLAAFHDRPRPQAAALDLAVLLAGLTAVPVVGPGASASVPAADVWVEAPGSDGERPVGGAPVMTLAPWSAAVAEAGFAPRPGGGAQVGSGTSVTLLDEAGLLAQAGSVAAEVAAAPPCREPQEILVSFHPLADPVERALRTWALTTGAAILLEPFAGAGLASVAWARPTLLAGSAAELALLRPAAAAGGARRPWRRRPRLPFGRLRLLLVTGELLLPEGEAAFWRERGTKVVRWPPVV